MKVALPLFRRARKHAATAKREITERLKGPGEELRQASEHLRALVESSPIAIGSVDLERRVLSWNSAAEQVLGYSAAEAIGQFYPALPPESEQRSQESLSRLFHGEVLRGFEIVQKRKDGRLIDTSISAALIRDETGAPQSIVFTIIDITERKAAEESLRRSQAHLARVQRVARIGSTEVDLASGEAIWSDEIFRLLDLPFDSVRPGVEAFAEAIHPDDRAKARDASQRGRRGEETEPIEFRVLAPDGTVHWFYRQTDFVRDPNGKPVKLIATMYDITERKRAEESMRRSQEHLARVQRVAKISSAEIDLRTREGYWSDEIYSMFGLPPSSVSPEPEQFLSRIHPEDRPLIRGAMERGLCGERVDPFEFRVPRPDGIIRWYYRQSDFLRDAQGAPTSYIATYVDITERKAAEEQYRLTFELAPVGIAHLALDGRFTLVNRTLCAMLGFTETEMLAQRYLDITHPDDRDISADGVRRTASGELAIASLEKRLLHKDGRTVWVRLTSRMSAPPADPNRYFITVYMDITAVKDGTAKRAELEEQLQQSQKMEAVGRLTGGVAHDFNNLLTVVLGNLELVRERVENDAKLLRQIDAAVMAGQRGADLTHRLLAFSRRQALEPVVVDANKRIGELLPLLRRTLTETVEIKAAFDADLWKMIVDPGQLESAILNLAVNARDAMPSGGTLSIATENVAVDEVYAAARPGLATGNYVCISVSDTGIGMPPEIVARAFEPFFTTKEVGKGTGLGLSMVYGFTKQSGGHAAIYSEIGQGTTVTLLMPAADSSLAETGGQNAVVAVRGTETILVVEDDQAVRTVTVSFLAALGYTVIEAGTVTEGMAHFTANDGIALILTDVILPGGEDGATLARRARALRPGTKVLFMSGYTEDIVMHGGRLDPGVTLLRKPFTRGQLAQKVRAVIDEPAPGTPAGV